jgi:hypothetical protein
MVMPRTGHPIILLVASGSAWALVVHALLGVSLPAVASFIALIAAAGFGLGYEMADGGVAAALFLTMAVAGVLVSGLWLLGGRPGPEIGVAFGTMPALFAAAAAYAGGELREGREWN